MTSMSAWRVALLGMAGLASAMGIGRFAFTPVLPLMQAAGELSLQQGAWLASSNYLGYLLGALLCIWLPPRPALWAKLGLLVVALATLAMNLPQGFALWLLWRFVAGVASALVLVGLSAWCLAQLASLQAQRLAGLVYAGVGLGLAAAGLAGLGAGVAGVAPLWLWALLGLAAGLVWLWLHTQVRGEALSATTAQRQQAFSADHWRLIACYGIFGIGYILPATFLPAMARQLLPDPAIYGWIWPAFGLAAAVSTLLTAHFLHDLAPRRLWAQAAWLMALGVALSVLSNSLAALLLSALCVGGTFMVMTMAGMQEARTEGGARLIAAMTASFAAGQIAGPLLVTLAQGKLLWPSCAGAALLLMSGLLLYKKP